MNNPIIDIESKIESFTTELIQFCKPLMLNKKYSSAVSQLLNCESNIRMTIEFAKTVETSKECYEKLMLTKEELQLMDYLFKSLQNYDNETVTNLLGKTAEILSDIEPLISNIKSEE